MLIIFQMLILFVLSLFIISNLALDFFVEFFLSAFEVVFLDESRDFMEHVLYLVRLFGASGLLRRLDSLQGFFPGYVGLDFVIDCEPVYDCTSQVVVVDVEVR